MITETKLDETFPEGQFLMYEFTIYKMYGNANGGGIAFHVREDIPSRQIQANHFFVEINLRKKN